ncbi:membrane protein [Chlamydia abortus LLG]|nr:membrane protein [Chlamydia abortus LLG]
MESVVLQPSITSTIFNLIFFLSPSILVFIFYRTLFKGEPLAPKKHFRKYKTYLFICALIVIALPVLLNTLQSVSMAAGKVKMRRVMALNSECIQLLSALLLIFFVWSLIEPFILCKKMRKIKNHYARLAKAAGHASVQSEQSPAMKCCSEHSCCSNLTDM